MGKGILIAALMMIVPLKAFAEDRYPQHDNYYAEHLTHELLDLLDQLEQEASYEARNASRYGQHAEAKALSDLASSAASLENKLYNSVLIPLRRGESEHIVKAYLQRLDSAFSLLEQDGRAVSRYNYYLANDVREILYLKSDLQRSLSSDDRGRPGRPVRPIR